MSVDRFKGEQGMAFIGSPYSPDQTADIHMYNHLGRGPLIDTFKIEDIVNAVNALPGVTATYTRAEPPLPELPKAIGSVVTSESGNSYVRVSDNKWVSNNYAEYGRIADYVYTDEQMSGGWLRKATIKEGPGA